MSQTRRETIDGVEYDIILTSKPAMTTGTRRHYLMFWQDHKCVGRAELTYANDALGVQDLSLRDILAAFRTKEECHPHLDQRKADW